MRRVMAGAVVGDDVIGEDPTVQALQNEISHLLDKEAALFVPSGTMANLIAVMNHCWGRGGVVIVGDSCHIFLKEHRGMAQLGGVYLRSLHTHSDGTFALPSLEALVRSHDPDYPVTSLVCVENTHNMKGGRVLPLQWMDELGITCRRLSLPLHMDGARLLNASVALQVPPERLVRDCASVSLCLSKGLGAPAGALLVGSRNFIDRAVGLRRMLGGAMCQSGILAAAGSLGLARYTTTLGKDHQHAKAIAQAVFDTGSDRVTVDVAGVHTNIIMLDCNTAKMTPAELQEKLEKVNESEESISVKSIAVSDSQVRLVTHCSLTSTAVDLAIRKIISVITK